MRQINEDKITDQGLMEDRRVYVEGVQVLPVTVFRYWKSKVVVPVPNKTEHTFGKKQRKYGYNDSFI